MSLYTGEHALKLAGEALERFRKGLATSETNSGRRAGRKIRAEAVASFASSGIGRAIWGGSVSRAGKKAWQKSIRVVIAFPRVRREGPNALNISMHLRGFAGLVEKGGQTKPHTIKPNRAKFLAFEAGRRLGDVLGIHGGNKVFTRSVRHPGSKVPRAPFAEPAMRKGVSIVARELDLGYEALAKKVGV